MADRQWHPNTDDDYERIVGRDVYTHDGERIGVVDRIIHPAAEMEGTNLGHFVVVRPDFLNGPLGSDVAYVPETAIAAVTPDAVELTVDRGEIAGQDWAHLPANVEPAYAPLPEDVPPVPEGNLYEESNRTAE